MEWLLWREWQDKGLDGQVSIKCDIWTMYSEIEDTKIRAWCWPRGPQDTAVKFLGLWNWVEGQGRHFSPEEQDKKHHKNGAQDWELACGTKKEPRHLWWMPHMSQNSNKTPPNRMTFWSQVLGQIWVWCLEQRTGEIITFILAPWVLTVALTLTSWAISSKVEDSSSGVSCKVTSYERGTDYSLFRVHLFKHICIINRLGG